MFACVVFVCGQAPTYVNVTVGSFVCQNCSGILRELQHRVKGLGLSDFSKQELDFLKAGNDVCSGDTTNNLFRLLQLRFFDSLTIVAFLCCFSFLLLTVGRAKDVESQLG